MSQASGEQLVRNQQGGISRRKKGTGSAANIYLLLVAVLLTLTALAKLVSAAGEARILGLPDPLLPLSNREVLLGVALVELAVAAYVVWGRSVALKHLWVLWLSLNFILYRLGLWVVAPGKPCPCLGTVAARLPLKPATVDWLLKLMVAYLFVGSLCYLAALWWRERKGLPSPNSAEADGPGAGSLPRQRTG